ncbi:hypothetical protein FRX31_032887 [Thalictrum thalictroides]|uniref:Pectinesterase inhibitor domain-containing protein n=1 Tax=Thalictrum thalictroides TaxID=46969 RepID=A0A7J6UY51_THATH|nr:hypothetical protein FRX31_032887 [Thalictrum thalictroides]
MLESAANIQEQLNSCLDSYLMLVADGYHANEAFNKKDYTGMLVNGQAISAGATKCEDVFKASPSPSYLTDRNLKMAILGQMIATMSTKFN